MTTPLIYIWSPGRVHRIAGNAGSISGTTLRAVAQSGSTVTVLIAHRNSLIRRLAVPSLSREEAYEFIKAKIASLLPVGFQNYTFDFRLIKNPETEGKLAVIGIVKTETLRRIHSEAHEAGLNLAFVSPAAFWNCQLAKAEGFKEGLITSGEGSDLCFDCVVGGEIVYSRFCAGEISEEEEGTEIEQTASLAGIEDPLIWKRADYLAADNQQSLSALLNLELPEMIYERSRKQVTVAARRAGIAALLAIGLCSFGLWKKRISDEQAVSAERASQSFSRQAFARLKGSQSRLSDLVRRERLFHIAFDPAQTFDDILAVVSTDSDSDIWLTGLTLQRGRPMSLRGQAISGKGVSKLMAKLSQEPRFRDVKLLFVNKGKLNNSPIFQFALQGFPVGNLPYDEIIESEADK